MRLSLYTEKQLKLDFLVATNRAAIVATIEPVWNRILLSRQNLSNCPDNEPSLDWLNYSAHDFCGYSAHYRACSFSIVKAGVKVITIEPSADALSVEESLTL